MPTTTLEPHNPCEQEKPQRLSCKAKPSCRYDTQCGCIPKDCVCGNNDCVFRMGQYAGTKQVYPMSPLLKSLEEDAEREAMAAQKVAFLKDEQVIDKSIVEKVLRSTKASKGGK